MVTCILLPRALSARGKTLHFLRVEPFLLLIFGFVLFCLTVYIFIMGSSSLTQFSAFWAEGKVVEA